ncbi:MAG: T6SS immunity protein Tdi1 domain-containing protein [Gimesia chilikensis]|uniref:T6SS immunity protein Tdi1 domain-containing protein n=1 Tax=Gimesia chilikensis TaxID=2605989 RepID=UPI0037A21A79
MALTLNDLTINLEQVDCKVLLDDWTWAMPESMQAVLVTAMGDVFAQGESGAIYFADMVEGKITPVAEDSSEFETLLQDPDFVTDLFFPARVLELREADVTLEPGQVYGHQTPLVLSGEDELDNIEQIDVAVHVSVHGQIHDQVKDLPPGTVITDIEFEEEA